MKWCYSVLTYYTSIKLHLVSIEYLLFFILALLIARILAVYLYEENKIEKNKKKSPNALNIYGEIVLTIIIYLTLTVRILVSMARIS